MFFLKTRSEDYLLKRLLEEISKLNIIVNSLFEEQRTKGNINLKISEGIRRHGRKFAEQMGVHKERLLGIIEEQGSNIKPISKILIKTEHLLNLL